MLAQQLRELENDNLIIKKIYPVIPPIALTSQFCGPVIVRPVTLHSFIILSVSFPVIPP